MNKKTTYYLFMMGFFLLGVVFLLSSSPSITGAVIGFGIFSPSAVTLIGLFLLFFAALFFVAGNETSSGSIKELEEIVKASTFLSKKNPKAKVIVLDADFITNFYQDNLERKKKNKPLRKLDFEGYEVVMPNKVKEELLYISKKHNGKLVPYNAVHVLEHQGVHFVDVHPTGDQKERIIELYKEVHRIKGKPVNDKEIKKFEQSGDMKILALAWQRQGAIEILSNNLLDIKEISDALVDRGVRADVHNLTEFYQGSGV
jgi:rRNA-processing protein FCF1